MYLYCYHFFPNKIKKICAYHGMTSLRILAEWIRALIQVSHQYCFLKQYSLCLLQPKSCSPATGGFLSITCNNNNDNNINNWEIFMCHKCIFYIILKSSFWKHSVQFSSVAQSCLNLCDPMKRSMPGLPVHHQLPEFTQTHVHQVSDAIQPSCPLSSPSPPAPNPSQHQSLFQWVNSSHEVAKVLELQSQHQSFQWTPRTDLL